MNLASSFVNGFVNAAFGQDKLLTEDGNKWLYKNKDHGKRLACTRTNDGFNILFFLKKQSSNSTELQIYFFSK